MMFQEGPDLSSPHQRNTKLIHTSKMTKKAVIRNQITQIIKCMSLQDTRLNSHNHTDQARNQSSHKAMYFSKNRKAKVTTMTTCINLTQFTKASWRNRTLILLRDKI